jgi:hypothetical protein
MLVLLHAEFVSDFKKVGFNGYDVRDSSLHVAEDIICFCIACSRQSGISTRNDPLQRAARIVQASLKKK